MFFFSFILHVHTTNIHTTRAQYEYDELSLALKIWVHLQQLRREGGVRTSGGIQSLEPGKNIVSPQVDR